jgi:hypothetical protein
MMKRGFMLAALLVLSRFAPPADAASMTYVGTFDTAINPTPGVPPSLSGTFTFDESLVPPSGAATFDVTPDARAMTPLGFATFTPANTGVELDYDNGRFVLPPPPTASSTPI